MCSAPSSFWKWSNSVCFVVSYESCPIKTMYGFWRFFSFASLDALSLDDLEFLYSLYHSKSSPAEAHPEASIAIASAFRLAERLSFDFKPSSF